ncbi:Crp/Fnr family transcriptional regulator [Riemerella columbipharyngis]|uniref:cAMP-binding domain of CRP or a regulatory subunit of cAMP-dependent protein kinases n=1 Tax=Riemerella columbipharyngis TaxID=1071918 RepID=A0A1G7C7R2_9FLAO|nr:Crp/Fnr family transcriptional regulator [Riemerella columbipharyngis]SDE34780.1 cAMP-binding domain of CRP or a regulatory subunit of cAMP-dependent protein kinases [Riemerella columbipharyngis]
MILNIDDYFLEKTQPIIKEYSKGDVIINEGVISDYFFYLKYGKLAVYNYTDEGKEFLQHKVDAEAFFGEPAVLLEKPFPGSVKVTSDKAEIIKIKRIKFMDFLVTHPEQCLEFTKRIATKAIAKSNTLKNIMFQNPEERILRLFENYKKGNTKEMKINITRNEISQMLGLRIETVIRTIKKMEHRGILKIKNGKVFY